MKNIYTICLVVFVFAFSYAQKIELGNVTLSELNQKAHPDDLTATAAYLFQKGTTTFEYTESDGFYISTIIESKIKIYSKEGYDFGNFEIPYYTPSSGASERVVISKAYTYNEVDGKVDKIKMKGSSEFTEKINSNWSKKKIALSDVKEGSIVEYRVEIKSPYITNFPVWDFQKTIPVNYSEYNTYIPEYFFYNLHQKGTLSLEVKSTKIPRTINYTYTENVIPGMSQGMPKRITNSIDFMVSKTSYVLKNIPAIKNEIFVNNIDNYKVALHHELAGRRMPNSGYDDYATNWETVAKTIYDSENFGEELKRTSFFEADINSLVSSVSDINTRAFTIFNYVKKHMNWNQRYGYVTDEGLKKAYVQKSGNTADINLLLLSMLRYAGVDANPVLLSTRSNGIPLYPNRTAFNYVIVAVEVPDGLILLDATNKFTTPNILPIETLNWNGRLIRKNGSSTAVNLIPNFISKEVTTVLVSLNEDATITGQARILESEYNAFLHRNSSFGLSKESSIEQIEKRHTGIEVSDFNVTNEAELSKPIIRDFSFTHANLAEIIADKIYFSPMLFFAIPENPFKLDSREYPIDFIFPRNDKYAISITIPDGYKIEHLPNASNVMFEDEVIVFKYNIKQVGNVIQLIANVDINQAIVAPVYYEMLKSFFKAVVEKNDEKVIVSKI
ncbi:DUF3857 domain-containing protein [Flavobacterium lacus]|uniref:Uncharacterized protein DUF3857 n=1 Tax=Flavobacterium lacus TaxID=1353778 RepID=A0A328WVK1_9FLAO|nr:transglutaminase domain-containing protein [Flavobacterium lacus]RAR50212.1 uncharacterized protein DUF3857 [Flavobacterium lacus]